MNFIPKIEYIELGTGTPKSILFDSPPEGDPLSEGFKPSVKRTRSTGGTIQGQFNYTLKSYKLEFIFQTEITKLAFDDFFLNHASKVAEFNYFIHSDEVDFETFVISAGSYKPKRPIPAATVGEFEYDWTFKVERVL